jgi:septum formation protein
MTDMQQTESRQRKIMLASASPRRRELLKLTGWKADVRGVDVDETQIAGESAVVFVRRLASQKAEAACARVPENTLIIAADTIVVDGNEVLGKPADAQHAREMLTALKGRSHRGITAISIKISGSDLGVDDLCETEVPLRGYSAREIEEYVQSGSPLDKAGAYGIQDQDFHPAEVDKMDGCFANVMGFPLCHLVRSMRKMNVYSLADVPAACQQFTGYHCGVYPQILRQEL